MLISERRRERRLTQKCEAFMKCISAGGYYEKATPVPIPNTAVKLLSADDTWVVTPRENRSLPTLYQNPEYITRGFVRGETYFPNVALPKRWH